MKTDPFPVLVHPLLQAVIFVCFFLSAATGQQTGAPQSSASSPISVLHGDGTPASVAELPASLRNAVIRRDASVAPPSSTTEQSSIDDAKAFAKTKDFDGVEKALTRSNLARPNTAGWHFETTRKLLETARQMTQGGDLAPSAELSSRALQHLAMAEAAAKDSRTKAQAKSQAAFIQLRYRGDLSTAIATYEAAAQLDPGNRGIQEALARVKETSALLEARVKALHH